MSVHLQGRWGSSYALGRARWKDTHSRFTVSLTKDGQLFACWLHPGSSQRQGASRYSHNHPGCQLASHVGVRDRFVQPCNVPPRRSCLPHFGPSRIWPADAYCRPFARGKYCSITIFLDVGQRGCATHCGPRGRRRSTHHYERAASCPHILQA
jgi:hypothetical protein